PAWGRVALPVVVQGEYDLTVDFIRLSGERAMFVGLPVGASHVLLQISGWHGQFGGLAFIDGQNTDVNPSGHRPSEFENNKKHSLLVKVRLKGEMTIIDATLDG